MGHVAWLRVNLRRYRASDATAPESALDDGLARYRVALANLRILTGSF